MKELALVSVLMDLGAGRRGVDMGPSAIRIAGLRDTLVGLDYRIREMGTVVATDPERTEQQDVHALYLTEVESVCRRARDLVEDALERGCMPLVLGGDHSIAIGSVAGVSRFYARRRERIGLIWVDAHSDMNTPGTSPSGNVHGMPLAVLTGHGPRLLRSLADRHPAVRPENVSMIGVRKIDPAEREVVISSGVRVFTMSEVDERGIAPCVEEAITRASAGTAGFHLSYDLDSLDPMIAPGVGTPVAGGLTFREGHLICEKVARSGRLVSLDMVELNPVLDAHNRTAQMAVGLIASALGQTIL
ncbi:MAG: arginase [Gammaproteobacteria bacterium]|nr:arginase [Gammaproteobacteria bacterium]